MVESAARTPKPLVSVWGGSGLDKEYIVEKLFEEWLKAKSISRMTEQLVSVNSRRKHIREPPSIPFLWEEKPGVPKKDWKPGLAAVYTASPPPPPPPPPLLLPPPEKLVASIPFTWEEKPGKPLPSFSPTPHDDAPLLLYPPKKLVCCSSLSDADSKEYQDDGDDGDDEHDGMFESDLEAFGFDTDDSFGSAPSLLANRFMSTLAISTAVPVRKTDSKEDCNDQTESPSSPASQADSSTSSYMTGTTSLAGSSFLERLFPLFQPNSGFLAKVGCHEGSPPPPARHAKEVDPGTNSRAIVRRAPTLGELILMSRRRSYRRKALQMRKLNLSVGFTKKRAFGCIFGTGASRIGGLLGKRRQPRLKLM